MAYITYVTPTGEDITVEVETDRSVMEGAVRHGVPGIVAECGGACSCATCHVYIDTDWMDVVGEPDEAERDMLEFAHEPTQYSRLTCQIKVSDRLDGLRVRIPGKQG
ncbi:2Fe-2S iron-sulfur cluster-binding protein [Microbacteriaceae bacterium K1510]|nr:2Fe-2S iron-sulfur cluster-binding protein [Microbacteriaceae bacterium K1510]